MSVPPTTAAPLADPLPQAKLDAVPTVSPDALALEEQGAKSAVKEPPKPRPGRSPVVPARKPTAATPASRRDVMEAFAERR